jgi:hypothetical protein
MDIYICENNLFNLQAGAQGVKVAGVKSRMLTIISSMDNIYNHHLQFKPALKATCLNGLLLGNVLTP